MSRDPLAPPAALAHPVTVPEAATADEPVRSVVTPVRLEYTYTPGRSLSGYLRAMKNRQVIGERCPHTGQVFVPPRGVSPVAGAATVGPVPLADTGYVESFNITRVPIPRRPDLVPPYCTAWVVLDGASVGMLGLVVNIEPEQVRIGMRVRAVWKPDHELVESAANILGWEPTGEPDQVLEDYECIGRAEPPPPVNPAPADHSGAAGSPQGPTS